VMREKVYIEPLYCKNALLERCGSGCGRCGTHHHSHATNRSWFKEGRQPFRACTLWQGLRVRLALSVTRAEGLSAHGAVK